MDDTQLEAACASLLWAVGALVFLRSYRTTRMLIPDTAKLSAIEKRMAGKSMVPSTKQTSCPIIVP